jgi:hypothetical protein
MLLFPIHTPPHTHTKKYTYAHLLPSCTSWMSKNPSIFVWQSFPFTVFPCWAGAALGITRKYTAHEVFLFVNAGDPNMLQVM